MHDEEEEEEEDERNFEKKVKSVVLSTTLRGVTNTVDIALEISPL
jgi:hypothetical protein